jgi:signal transduction histidine kinase
MNARVPFDGLHDRRVAQDGRVFLSTLPADQRERRLALAVIVASVAIFVIAAPFAKVPLTPVAAFIPIYQSALVINDLITAVLLFGQFSFLKSRALLALASGYLFSAAMAVSHALTFPGLFAPTGLLNAGPQSTAWLYFIWHAAFPLFIIAYTRTIRERPEQNHRPARVRSIILLSIAVTLAGAIALTLIATAQHAILPTIMQGNKDAPAKVVVATATWMLSLIALLVLWRRRPHSVLDVWLMVVLCAWLFDSALASVLNAGRYDVGWYAGRVYGLLASSFVLMVLLIENSVLYVRLVQAHENLSAANHALETSREALNQRGDELRQTNAKLAAASEAKDRFLATMSHELRTPLNAIIGFTGLLQMKLPGPLNADQEKHIGIVQTSAQHLLSLINDLLDLARIESGKVELKPEPVVAQHVVNEVIEALRPIAEGKGLELASRAPATAVSINVDRRAMFQIVMNLANNAIKYTDSGSVSIELAEHIDDDRLRAEISVADTGVGIKEEDKTRLFNAFERVGDSDARRESTGLGLYYSLRLTELIGGKLTFQSEYGQGSTFTLYLSSQGGIGALAT